MLSIVYYALLFCVFLATLLMGLSLSMLALGDVFGVIAWVIFVSFLLASLYDDGNDIYYE
jgi:hypothetical protein